MKHNPVIDQYGNKYWYDEQDRFHRADGPAVEYTNGTKGWFQHGEFHREDGPAVEYPDGDKWWYQHGQFHREDGPAVEYANGYKYWYYKDNRLDVSTQEEFEKLMKLKAFW